MVGLGEKHLFRFIKNIMHEADPTASLRYCLSLGSWKGQRLEKRKSDLMLTNPQPEAAEAIHSAVTLELNDLEAAAAMGDCQSRLLIAVNNAKDDKERPVSGGPAQGAAQD